MVNHHLVVGVVVPVGTEDPREAAHLMDAIEALSEEVDEIAGMRQLPLAFRKYAAFIYLPAWYFHTKSHKVGHSETNTANPVATINAANHNSTFYPIFFTLKVSLCLAPKSYHILSTCF